MLKLKNEEGVDVVRDIKRLESEYTEVKKQLDLLDSHFTLICFDATVGEILDFLNIEIINLMSEKNDVLINYININVGKGLILEKFNKKQVAEEVHNHFLEDIGRQSLYAKFNKFESDKGRIDAVYALSEANKTLYKYNQTGQWMDYTAQEKYIDLKSFRTFLKRYYGSEALG